MTEQQHLQRAKDFEDAGDLQASLIELKSTLQKNPNNPEARWLLGKLYIKLDNGNAAEQELVRARGLGVAADAITIPLGEAMLLQAHNEQVLKEIQSTAGMSASQQAQILRIRGDAQLALRHLSEACSLYEQSVATDKKHPPAYWGLANCAMAKRDTTLAEHWLKEALQQAPKDALSWIRMGDFYRLMGRYKEAEAAFDNAVKSDPKNTAAYINRAGARLALNNPEAAENDVEEARKLSPKDPLVKYMDALFDYRSGKFTAAQDKIQEVLHVLPNHYQSVYLYGMITYQLGHFESAINAFGRLLEAAPVSTDVRMMLARTQLKVGQSPKALETLKPLLSSKEPDATTLALAGEAYQLNGDFAAAQRYLQRALELAPQNLNLMTQLAGSQLAQGQTASAIAELEQVASTSARPTSADTMLIMIRLQQQDYDQAFKDLEKLSQKQPDSPTVANLRGLAYVGKKDRVHAKEQFQTALKLNPTYIPAAANLSLLALQDNKPDEARQAFKTVLEKDSSNLDAMLGMAEIANSQNQPEEYENWLSKAVKAHPKSERPQQILAEHYLLTNQPHKALSAANTAIALSPDNPALLTTLAKAQMANGELTSAISSLIRVTTLQPKSVSAHIGLANAEIRAGNTKAAREAVKRALELDPEHLDAKAVLVTIEAVEGHLDAALRRAVDIQTQAPKRAIGFILAGDLLMTEGKYLDAAGQYGKAYQIQKNGPVAMSWSKALQAAKKGDQAYDPLRDWLKTNQADATARLYLATAYRNGGQFDKALQEYQHLIEQNPENALAHNELAITYQSMDKLGDALTSAEQAYKLQPVPAIADTLAWILLAQNRSDQALQLLEKALASGTRNPEIRYHYAVALSRTGHNDQARKELKELLAKKDAFPQRAAAKALLEKL